MTAKLFTLKRAIETLDDLHYYLRIAMELELSTIPPYMCGIYSIRPSVAESSCFIIEETVYAARRAISSSRGK